MHLTTKEITENEEEKTAKPQNKLSKLELQNISKNKTNVLSTKGKVAPTTSKLEDITGTGTTVYVSTGFQQNLCCNLIKVIVWFT